MKSILLFLTVLLSFSFSDDNIQTINYSCEKFTAIYHTVNGMIDGKYQSFYPDGSKKSVGDFEFGNRVGTWIVWNEKHEIANVRIYKNMFEFKQIPNHEEVVTDTDKPVADVSDMKLNAEGFIDNMYLTEKMVIFSKRYWRNLSNDKNPLFAKYNLKDVFANILKSKKIKIYSSINSSFTKELVSVPPIENMDINGYLIMEDFVYDSVRLVGEKRIIGICPYTQISEDSINKLFWIYFPNIRKDLAKVKIEEVNIPAYITTLDNLFYHRYFSSWIYKQENVYDAQIKDYKKKDEILKEAENIEIQLIETEHNLWIMK